MTNRASNNRVQTRLFAALCIAYVAVQWLIYALMPLYSDDFIYSRPFYGFLEEGGPLKLSDFTGMIADRWTDEDNVRLSNILLLPLMVMPKWLAALAPAAGVAVMLAGVRRAAAIKQTHLLLWSIALTLLTFWLPWFENFYTLCYGMNYVVPAGLTALWVAMLVNNDHRGWIVGLPLGFFHEGFTLPLLAGGLAYLVVQRSKRGAWSVASLVPGAVYLIVTSLLIDKVSYFGNLGAQLLGGILPIAKLQLPFYLFLIALGVTSTVRRTRQLWKQPVMALIVVASVCAIGMNMMFHIGERQSTLAHLLSIIGLLWIAEKELPSLTRGCTKLKAVLTALIVAILVGHFTLALRATVHFRTEVLRVNELVKEGHSLVFADLDDPLDAPLLQWRTPIMLSYPQYSALAWHFYRAADPKMPQVAIVPAELCEADTEGIELPGGTGAKHIGRSIYIADNDTVSGLTFEPFMEQTFTAQAGPFKKKLIVTPIPFTSASGQHYFYLYTNMAYFPSYLLPITALSL